MARTKKALKGKSLKGKALKAKSLKPKHVPVLERPSGHFASAQTLCSRNKCAVFFSNCLRYADKGPYNKMSKAFKRTVLGPEAFRAAADQLKQRCTMTNATPLEIDGKQFVRFPNLGNTVDRSSYKEKKDVSKIYEATVVPRTCHILRLNDVPLEVFSLHRVAFATLYHLMLRCIFEVGDSGLNNMVLVKPDVVFGLDIEERCGRKSARKKAKKAGRVFDYNDLTIKELLFPRGCKKAVWMKFLQYGLENIPRMSAAQLSSIDEQVDLAGLWSPLEECEKRRAALMGKLALLRD